MVTAIITARTKAGEEAIRSFMEGKLSLINVAAMKPFGITETRKVVSEKPYEISFSIDGKGVVAKAFLTPYFLKEFETTIYKFFKKNKVPRTGYKLVVA